MHKGRVEAVARRARAGWVLVANGDDRTDEDLFAALPPDAAPIHVGPKASSASVHVSDAAAVRWFLRALLTA
jgi:trehalose 6-phosphate synthase/phosphatase